MATIADVVQGAIPGAGDWLAAAWGAFSQAAGATLVTAVWQGAAIASGLAICLRFAPRISAAHRFAVWTAGLAVLVSLPFLPFFARVAGVAALSGQAVSAQVSTNPWLHLDRRWSVAIAALWAAAAFIRAMDLGLHSVRLRRLWKTAKQVESGHDLQSTLTASLAIWGRGPVQVCTTKTLERPSVIGFLAPRILIPDWLLAHLTQGELEQIVLHEAEHLRRWDDWSNLLQKLCLVLFPLNPVLWWMERRLCLEREMACDEGVVRVTHAPRAYAACLAGLAERGLQRRAGALGALSLGAWQRRPELMQRVHRILLGKRAQSPLATGALLGVVGCGLVFASLELAQCPRLVEFVPARQADVAKGLTYAQPQVHPERLLSTAGAPGWHDVKVKASLPDTSQRETTEARGSGNRTVQQPAAGDARMASASEPDFLPAQANLLKAEVPVSSPHAVEAEQWIVLTTWEQVQTSNQAVRELSDYDAGQGEDRATAEGNGQENGQANVHVTERFSVTRLIFRVIPPASTSTRPAAAPVRGSWFVIQL